MGITLTGPTGRDAWLAAREAMMFWVVATKPGSEREEPPGCCVLEALEPEATTVFDCCMLPYVDVPTDSRLNGIGVVGDSIGIGLLLVPRP